MQNRKNVLSLLTGGVQFGKRPKKKRAQSADKLPVEHAPPPRRADKPIIAITEPTLSKKAQRQLEARTSREAKRARKGGADQAATHMSAVPLFSTSAKNLEESEEDGREEVRDTVQAAPSDATPRDDSSTDATRHEERVREVMREHNVRLWGERPPLPVVSFDDMYAYLQLPDYLYRCMQQRRYESPTPVQMAAVPAMIAGRDVLAFAPTGSGKTIAFLIPVLCALHQPSECSGVRALLLSPTHELAEQTYIELRHLLGNGGPPLKCLLLSKENCTLSELGEHGADKFDIIVSTPVRASKAMQTNLLKLDSVEHLVFDEADRLFDATSSTFLSDVGTLIDSCGDSCVKSLFSATILPPVEELARSVLREPVKILVGGANVSVSSVRQHMRYCSTEDGKLMGLRHILRDGIAPPILVFVQSKDRADQLYVELRAAGKYEEGAARRVGVVHGDRPLHERQHTIAQFRSGEIWVLITTELMARGMDFAAVNVVINYDMPQTVTSYIHRVGRTGRAGRQGEAITLYTNLDRPMVRSIATVMAASGNDEEVPEWMLNMRRIDKRLKRKREMYPVRRKRIVPRAPKDRERVRRILTKRKRRKMERRAANADSDDEHSDASSSTGSASSSSSSSASKSSS